MDSWLQGPRSGDGFNGDYLVYDAQYVNNTRTEGDLIWYTSNGTEVARYRATSGSGYNSKWTIPEGTWTAYKYEPTDDPLYSRFNIGFKVRLGPDRYDPNRGYVTSGILIHPVKEGSRGTEGCIGLISDESDRILDFQNRISTYLETNKTITLIVKFRKRR